MGIQVRDGEGEMMLEIKFSNHYKKMPTLGILMAGKTTLLNYTVVSELSPEFMEYDTAIMGGGNFRLWPHGPYLILFLCTKYPQRPHHYWTTVRTPWRRQAKACFNCDGVNCGNIATLWQEKNPWCWHAKAPDKYRQARGKEVGIVVEGE